MESRVILPSLSKELKESIKIDQENKKYLLEIQISSDTITLTLTNIEEVASYSRQLSLKEIKEIHQVFMGLNSCKEFSEFLKSLLEIKKLLIDKKENGIYIHFEVEYLLKKKIVDIELFPEKINYECVIKGLLQEINLIKEKIKDDNKMELMKNLENENKELKKEIDNLKKENTNLKEEINQIKNVLATINKKYQKKYSVIMEEKELDFIKSAIESRINKQIKKIKKLYQATIDGDDASIFHKKCDNIPNTLTVIKSKENRRFGGFTTQVWDNSNSFKKDENAFLFSLDKSKIYKIKHNCEGRAIWSGQNYGPVFGRNSGGIFGNSHDICIGRNPLNQKSLHTYEFCPNSAYDYSGDNAALSECGKEQSSIYAEDYEVFQIIF